MIITLVKADFSSKNIGTLGSFAVLTNILNATYSGPTSVEKDSAFTATITMHDGYIPENIVVTMGGEELTDAVSIADSIITLTIAAVTGVIVINMAGTEWSYPVVTWEDGSLASATGTESTDASRIRTGFISLSDIQGYITVPSITASQFIVSCYNASQGYLGQLSKTLDGTVVKGSGQWIATGTQIPLSLLETVENIAYIRVIANNESAGVQFIMNGQILDTWNPNGTGTEGDTTTTVNEQFEPGTLMKEDGKEGPNEARARTKSINVADLTGTSITVKECNFIIAGFDADGNYLGQYSTTTGDFDLVGCQTSAIWLNKTTQIPIANLTNATTIRFVAYSSSAKPYIYIDNVKTIL